MDGGRTWSLYSCGCESKSSQLGIETVRTAIPLSASFCWAATIRLTSDPVAIKIVDLLPAYPEDMRALFAKERLILDKKQIDQLLSAVKKYV